MLPSSDLRMEDSGTYRDDSASNFVKDLSLPLLVSDQTDVDALLVLEAKGTWIHAGYHLSCATAGPALLSLPFAFTFLGMGPGIVVLLLGAGLSFYSYSLLSVVLEHLAAEGKRFVRFSDLADYALGSKWSFYLVSPLQFVICFVTVIAAVLVGGVCMREIFKLYDFGNKMRLYEFIIIFGTLTVLLAQLPSFHSLRHVNLLSLLLYLVYSLCAICGSIIAGHSEESLQKSYRLTGTGVEKIFGIFGGISIVANSYGNAIIAEIQATVAPPVGGKMIKGLMMCYSVVVSTFITVAVSGYWAFGNASTSNLFDNMSELVPKWLLIVAYGSIFLQLVAISVVYLQPAFEVLEVKIADVRKGRFAPRNFLPRLIGRTFFVGIATFFAAMLPFFGDINALMGAVGYTPLTFVFPQLFYIMVLKPAKHTFKFWGNCIMIVVFSILTVLGSLATFGNLALDASRFQIFSDDTGI